MENFEEILKRQLDTPASYTGTDENGNRVRKQITPMEAMVKSVVNNAMKGDISSIQFVRMLTRESNTQDAQKARQRHTERLESVQNSIREYLERNEAYDRQDEEIKPVAEIELLLQDLDDIVNGPDFQIYTTDYKNGHQTVSPVIALRDKQRELFQQQLEKLRTEGHNRVKQRKTSFRL